VGTVLLAIAPALVFLYFTGLPWVGFTVGLFALAAAWVGGECVVMRQVRRLLIATDKLAAGDLTCRTGLAGEPGELGELARKIDVLAERVEERVREREIVEKNLLNRSLQQTVVSALGQFALLSTDFDALLHQVTMLVTQTLEVEYCAILELGLDGSHFRMRAGVGWQESLASRLKIETVPPGQLNFALRAGEPVVFDDLPSERRYQGEQFLLDHGVLSGVTVAIPGAGTPFGVLGAYTAHRRAFNEDEVHFLLAVATVLAMASERNVAASKLEKLAAFARLNPNPAMELGPDATITYHNDAAQCLAASVGQPDLGAVLPHEILEIVRGCLRTGHSKLRHETHFQGRTLSWSFHPVGASQVVHAYVEDITERLSLEAQLRQSQKMESIGQLAAGMAHDFNNMLTVIIGHVGMLQLNPKLTNELRTSVEAISFASERATSLTRQLLVFSRKNIMQAKLVDLREVVKQMSRMVQRLLGETIALELHLAEEGACVMADTGMIEQVIMNLSVNARDAMPNGGRLTISVDPIEVDEAYLRTRADARSGKFLRLRVSDTGSGMDEATMQRIFEPFFTTKEVGKGTGLGLATVYGIVKQHDGWVDAASEVGRGSSFDVYLPASGEVVAVSGSAATAPIEAPPGQERILVVEDEPVLRELARAILESCGYEVLEAGSGPEALVVWTEHGPGIDLVLTDMVMPDGMSGLDLAQRLVQDRPTLPLIFASGYSMEEMDTSLFQKGSVYLQKPYTHFSLAKAVRDALDTARRHSESN
jgi:signal transduction histidine kinase/CheY-like chemotaxis protein/HAMP domain-containing protein